MNKRIYTHAYCRFCTHTYILKSPNLQQQQEITYRKEERKTRVEDERKKDANQWIFVQLKKESLNGSLTAVGSWALGGGIAEVGIALNGICGGWMIFSNGFFLDSMNGALFVLNSLSTSTSLLNASSNVVTFCAFSNSFVPFLQQWRLLKDPRILSRLTLQSLCWTHRKHRYSRTP